MVSTKSLVRNMGLSLLLVFWCLSINLSPALAADASSKAAGKAAPLPPLSPKSPKAAGSAPQPRSFYGGYGGGYGGGHDLFDRGFGGDFLPILAVIGFAVIFLPIFGKTRSRSFCSSAAKFGQTRLSSSWRTSQRPRKYL